MHRVRALLVMLIITPCVSAQMGEVRARGWVHVNGYSHHFAAGDTNNNIFGTGFTWYRTRHGRMHRAWETDLYQDSARRPSGYVGHSWTRPFGHVSAGATAALMYHRNFKKQNRWGVLPVVLPFAEIQAGEHAKLRVYYIPPLRDRDDHQIALQLVLPFWRGPR